ncbi:hypothetical protein CRG98_033498 [Punica granatum]|uniref:Uncharacterized protein n=1 Tax=Punica granatum TaxID=22663 RepID=A0A2I0IQW9_PUNGR|nr:hypothetical protein CRG98_033498 [Punica granatum]
MARASDMLSIIFTIIILVSILFLCDLIHGRAELLTSGPNNDKPGLKETVVVGGQVRSCLIPNGSSCLVVITWQDQAVPKSTSPGHSPGIGDSPSGSENSQRAVHVCR